MDLRGDDLRINIERRKMERIGESSGGFGLAMDNFGRWYETHNLTHVSQLVFPSRYFDGLQLTQGHTLVNISDHEENGLARIYPVGEQETRVNHPEQSGYFSGACGITWYGDGKLGPQFDNTIWVADVVLNLVHADKLSPDKTKMLASRIVDKREVLASEDRSFRPVNLLPGPDGALYIIDIYRKVIEHPEWIPDEIEQQLDLSEGKDKGRIYKLTGAQSLASFEYQSLTDELSLIANLSSATQWVRMTSQQLLIERGISKEGVEHLRKLTRADNALARLHALWILHLTEKLSSDDMAAAMSDAEPGIRENALIMAEENIGKNNNLFAQAVQLLQDDTPRVRMQAALSLSVGSNNPLNEPQRTQLLEAIASSVGTGGDEWNIAAVTLVSKYFPSEMFRLLARKPSAENAPLLASIAITYGNNGNVAKSILDELAVAGLSAKQKADVVKAIATVQTDRHNSPVLAHSIQKLESGSGNEEMATLALLRNSLGLSPSPAFLRSGQLALNEVINHG